MKPFIKYVGGKKQFLPLIENYAKRIQFNRVIEPFCGSAAVTLFLRKEGSIISDLCRELIYVYEVVRDYPKQLMFELDKLHPYNMDKVEYYEIRTQYNLLKSKEILKDEEKVRLSALYIFLNKNCYNGMYRVNSKGEFNTPVGRYKHVDLYEIKNINECSQFLMNCKIINTDFLETTKTACADDLVILDPPYYLHTENYYNKDKFSFADQKRVYDECCRLDSLGIKFMAFNSNESEILNLYSNKFHISVIIANNSINSDSDNRKRKEILITNIDYKE